MTAVTGKGDEEEEAEEEAQKQEQKKEGGGRVTLYVRDNCITQFDLLYESTL